MYRVRIAFAGLQGAPWLATHYFSTSFGGTAQQAVNALGTMWGGIDFYMNTSITWSSEAEVATVDDSTGQVTAVTATTPVTGAGGTGGDMQARAAQGLIRWRTGVFVGGREVRGRTFIPGLYQGVADATGGVDAATITAINTLVSAFIADANSTPVVYSRAHAQAQVISTGSMWNQFAVLRSRRD